MASQLSYYLAFLRKVLPKFKVPFLFTSIAFLLLGIGIGYQLNKPSQASPEYKLLQLRNKDKPISYIRTLDIDNDGVDELVYEPRSTSWYNKTFILKGGEDGNSFVSFCEHCQFETYASSIEFKNLNNDGFLDIRLPMVVDSKDNYKKSTDIIFLFDGKDFIKQ